MRCLALVRARILLLFLASSWLGAMSGEAAAQLASAQPRAGLAVWDTGQPSALPLAIAALDGKHSWTTIPAGETAASFKGDAVLTNGRLSAVVRKQASAVEVYTLGPQGTASRVQLRLLATAGQAAARLQRVALVENTRSAVSLEVAYATARGAEVAAKFRLKRGDISIQTEPGNGAGRLRVECPGRFLVLPDFFADDIVI